MKKNIFTNLLPPITQNNQLVGRVFCLDLLKAISIAAVVFYHSTFVPISTYAAAAVPELIITAPLRFCVPVLFTISFILFEREFSKTNAKSDWSIIKKRVQRIAIPIVFWFSIAAALQLLKGSNPTKLIIEVLTGTIYIGAFYLVVLVQFIPIFTWIRKWFSNVSNIVITILIQGFIFLLLQALLAGNFGASGSYIIDALRNINRPLFIYWFVYMALGYYCFHNWLLFEKVSAQITTKMKMLLVVVTSIVMTFEYNRVITGLEGDSSTFEYALLACIISVFVAFLCFASVKENQLPPLARQAVQLLSTYCLGIFCINGILSQVFSVVGRHLFSTATFNLPQILLAKLVGWVILLGVSLGLSILLDKIRLEACVR